MVFGVSASPFLLNATLRHHLEQYLTTHPDTVQRLLQSMYVDDIVTSVDTEEDAFKFYVESKRIFSEASFNLRKFVTNSKGVHCRITHAE